MRLIPIYLIAGAALLVFYQSCGEFAAKNSFVNSSSNGDGSNAAAILGKSLYQARCQACHQSIESSAKMGRSPEAIQWGIDNVPEMKGLSLKRDEIRAIAEALRIDQNICEVQDLPGNVPTHRMSHNEYSRAVNDLFGIDEDWTSGFTADNYGGFFQNESYSKQINSILVQAYFDKSREIVDTVFQDQTARARLMTCNANQGDQCAQQVLAKVARLAFRRPLEQGELQELMAPYEASQELGLNFEDSLKSSLRGILINPSFLFKVYEHGEQPVRKLSSFEIASRLASFIWGSLPDEALLNAAATSDLSDPKVLKPQLLRMLKDPRSSFLVDGFANQWLALDKINDSAKQPDPEIFPEFTPELKEDMLTETRMFVSKLIEEDKSPLDLISGKYTYINNRLSNHYGFGNVDSNAFVRVNVPEPRTGILTHGSIMTMTSNPNETSVVNRGVWMMERMLCETPPPDAPADVDTDLPVNENLSLRERLEQHRSNPACMSCHSVMDPLGFGFENFGPIGQFRLKWEDGFNIDASGKLPSGANFNGASDLASKVADSDAFQACFTKHLMAFATTRITSKEDRCTINRIGTRDVTKDAKFSDVLLSIVLSDPFLRQQQAEEVQ